MASTAEVAEELGEPVGQGSRYEIDDDLIPTLKKEFKAWSKGKAKKASEATTPAPTKGKKNKAPKPAPEPEVLEDEDLELDDLEEPTPEALNEEPDFTDEELDSLIESETAPDPEVLEVAPKPKAPRKSRAKKA